MNNIVNSLNKLTTYNYFANLINKIKSDMSHGIRSLGNYKRQADKIIVWTTFESTDFCIIVTSSLRFGQQVSSIEIQEFNKPNGIKLILESININSNKPEIKFEDIDYTMNAQRRTLDKDQIMSFLEEYKASEPNQGLMEDYIDNDRYREYEWVKKN